jgi:hypothetical protein
MKKKIMCGLDFLRDGDWNPIVRTREGAMAVGRRTMPEDLKAIGFGVAIFETADYYRVSYGRKA